MNEIEKLELEIKLLGEVFKSLCDQVSNLATIVDDQISQIYALTKQLTAEQRNDYIRIVNERKKK